MAEGQELGKMSETGLAYTEIPKIIPPVSSLTEGMQDASDFYSQVLAMLAKVNNQDVNLLSEQFRDELQRLVSFPSCNTRVTRCLISASDSKGFSFGEGCFLAATCSHLY